MTWENPMILSNSTIYLETQPNGDSGAAGIYQGGVLTMSGAEILGAGTTNIFAAQWNDKNYLISGQITGSGSIAFESATISGNMSQTNTLSNPSNNYSGFTEVLTVAPSAGNPVTLVLGTNNAVPATSTLIVGKFIGARKRRL